MRTTIRFRAVYLTAALTLTLASCQTTGPTGGEAPPKAEKAPAGGAIAALRVRLHDPDLVVRINAADELGHMARSSSEAVDLLVGALADPAPLVRRFAAGGLADLPSPSTSTLSALAKLLRDPEADPRESASRTLATLTPRAPAEAVPELATALAAAAADGEEMVRSHSLEALGALGARGVEASPAVKPALERALSDKSDNVRGAAAAAIGQLGASVPWSVGLLAKALADPVHDVRKQAVVALEKIGPEAAPATKAIARLLHGKEIYLRVFAADTLTAIGPGARAALPELRAMQKRGWKDLEKSHEMEAGRLPEAVANAIASLEGKRKE